MIRKRLLSAYLALALCLSLLPATALAAENAPATLIVGGTNVIGGGSWTTSDGKLSEYTNSSDAWNVNYDTSNNTLTLKDADITGATIDEISNLSVGIYASGSSEAVSLNIILQGDNNQVSGVSGIYVFSDSGDASLSISGTGSLTAEGTGYGNYSGIMVQSNGGKAELTINNVDVTATNSNTQGIRLQPAGTSPATLAVNGGSLTASGSKGIDYQFGTGTTGSGTPTVTVSNNAIVRANGSISNNSSTEIQIDADSSASSGGIVFDGNEGTVYGKVTLEENLTIGEGESLTLDNDASLNAGNYDVIVDGGTLDDSIKNSLGDSVKYTPTITTTTLTDGTVGTSYSQTLTATGTTPITWSVSSGSLPTGLTLSSDGKISGTPTTAGTYSFTVTATNTGGSDSKPLSITISSATNIPVQSVSLDKANLELTEGETAQLTVTVLPDNATNKNVTWSTSKASIATVNNGEVTAVSAGTATITVTTEDGGLTADCTVTVREGVPDRPVSIPDTHEIELIAGEGGEAKTNFSNAGAGTKITVAATPDAGYELAYITVDGERISGVSFTMPAHDVTVRVYFSGGALPFADVTEGAWYADAVSYVYANGLMDGVSASEFAPEANMTRAMLVTILWRLEGEPVVNYLMPFADVDGGAWYAEAVRWAASEGIVEGVSASEFAPDAEITREQLAAILWRYAGEPATAANLAAYTDAESVSEWATDAMLWATQNGIITGTTADTLAPQGAATRAQCAAMLMRFAER